MNLREYWAGEAAKLRDTSALLDKSGLNVSNALTKSALSLLNGVESYPPIKINLIAKGNKSEDTPATVVSIQEYLRMLRDVETLYFTEAEQRDRRLMATQFRKMYYDDPIAWDSIIVGAKNIRCVIPITEPIRQVKIIKTADGIRHNIQHVFAGIDAMNYPREVVSIEMGRLWSSFGVKNSDAATWAGDLGTVNGFFYLYMRTLENDDNDFIRLYEKTKGGRAYQIAANQLIQDKWQSLVDKEASPEDLIGDIDGLVLGKVLTLSTNYAGQRLSEILTRYYVDREYYRNRFTSFSQVIQLTTIPKALETYKYAVSGCAMMNILRKNKFHADKKLVDSYPNVEYMGKEGSAYLLKYFFESVKENI